MMRTRCMAVKVSFIVSIARIIQVSCAATVRLTADAADASDAARGLRISFPDLLSGRPEFLFDPLHPRGGTSCPKGEVREK
jgi:hypothetical protein